MTTGLRRTRPAAIRHGLVAIRMNGVQVSLQVMVPSKSKSARLLTRAMVSSNGGRLLRALLGGDEPGWT